MADYSPFDKELKDLDAQSLSALRHAAEGWYVEYKREVPNATSIAKSISAFANTYGGWLFYGVKEKSKEDAVADAFPGVPRAEVDACLQRIRQAIASQTNPSPHFDVKVVWGPCSEIELETDRAVICVHVPWSPIAPHVHKSGQIYRRVADGSEPRPEGDRFVLDQLFRRADDLRELYREWINRDPEFSKGEQEGPYLRLMLVADLWRDRDPWVDVSVEEICDIMGQTKGLVSSVPFDTVHTMSGGFIARQLENNNPFNLGLSWRFRPSLVSDVLIPLNLFVPRSIETLTHDLNGYAGIDRFSQMLITRKHDQPRVVDLNYLFSVLIGVVEIQRRLMDKAGWKHGYYGKARLLNVWRSVPFLDVESVLDGFEKHGIPMCLDSKVTTPDGLSPETFAKIDVLPHIDNAHAQVVLETFALFAPIARAFGLPVWIDPKPDDTVVPYFEELQAAGRRAMEVQRRRNERARQGHRPRSI